MVDFKLTIVSPYDFLKRLFHLHESMESHYPLACYLLELFLYNSKCNTFTSSEKAISAFCLSAKIANTTFNRMKIRKYINFDTDQINLIIKETLRLINVTTEKRLYSLRDKFKDNKFLEDKIFRNLKIVKNV